MYKHYSQMVVLEGYLQPSRTSTMERFCEDG